MNDYEKALWNAITRLAKGHTVFQVFMALPNDDTPVELVYNNNIVLSDYGKADYGKANNDEYSNKIVWRLSRKKNNRITLYIKD